MGHLRWAFVIAAGVDVAFVGFGCAKIDGAGVSPADGMTSRPEVADVSPDRPGVVTDAAVESARPCVGLQCQQVPCGGGAMTSVSGTVFAPNGTLPLYNVIVYVPNAPLEPFPAGITCDRCGALASGSPIASAISDSHGQFRVTNVPVGANIPLVFQVGKWRRKVTIPSVSACRDNPLTDANLTRLPRNRREGDLPKIAATTGGCDQLGCLLPKLGVDPDELGASGDDKAVTFFRGFNGVDVGPPNMRDATELWTDESQLARFDVTMLSCECAEFMDNKSLAAFAAMTNYLARGGRIFGTDFAYMWMKYTPDSAMKAAISIASHPPGRSTIGSSPMMIDTSFPKGKALADWMKFVDPTVAYGQITAVQVFDNVLSVTAPSGLTWASSLMEPSPYVPPSVGPEPRIVTINTPPGVAADKQCGRAAHLDAHITTIDPGMGRPFPVVCGTGLSKGEEALAFLFFDLASCIQDDRVAPVVPPIIVQ